MNEDDGNRYTGAGKTVDPVRAVKDNSTTVLYSIVLLKKACSSKSSLMTAEDS